MTAHRVGLGAALAGAALMASVITSAAAGAADQSERHCVVEVIGEVDGVLVTGPEECFAKSDDAAAYDPAQEDGGMATASESSSNTIGVHYTSQSFTGSSIRIVGTTCTGGVWYATSSWNNNIESSLHYCGSKPTTFHDYSTCGGAARSITSASSTLHEMNNRASCVSYG